MSPDTLPRQVSMRTRDGVRLDADLYMPAGDGPFPVLLMRQPYGRRIASTVTYAHPAWYAAHGYIVVIQDVRGRGTSEGTFEPFVNEQQDGEDTLEWVASLSGSNGRVGMYGFSYQGVTQLLAAASHHPALQAMVPAMCGFHLEKDWATEGGAMRLYNTLTWAAQLGAETARREGDHALFAQCYRLGHGPGAHELIDPASPGVRALLAGTHYDGWLDSAPGSDYWKDRSPGMFLDGVDLPCLHIGGWYDSFLTGTFSAYRHFETHCDAPQKLLIGPWTHLPWTPAVGASWLGESAVSAVDFLQLNWFDRFLRDRDNGVDRSAPVTLYDLRAQGWREQDSFSRHIDQRLHLHSNGRAALDTDAGVLAPQPATSAATDVLVNDPWRPVPTTGGHLAPSVGIQDRTAIDARPDVATYTTAPLSESLLVGGEVVVTLVAAGDEDSFDLSAVLSVVDAQGRARNLTQGYCRVRNDAGPYRVAMRGACALIRPGERLRLSVSGSSYPAYTLNDGSGRVPGAVRAADYKVTTLRLDAAGSFIEWAGADPEGQVLPKQPTC